MGGRYSVLEIFTTTPGIYITPFFWVFVVLCYGAYGKLETRRLFVLSKQGSNTTGVTARHHRLFRRMAIVHAVSAAFGAI